MKKIIKTARKILIFGVVLGGVFSFTGCSLFNKDPQKFSYTQLEALEDTIEPLVSEYFNEKYGVQAVVTYKEIAGGVFLGPDPSSEQYYLVTVNIADGDTDREYYVNVYGRKVDGVDELYVKSEAYYGQVIKERMEEWLDGFVSKTNIGEYYILYNATISNRFPSEYKVTAAADEIIKYVSNVEGVKEIPSLPLYVLIPESEYEKNTDIMNEFDAVSNYLAEQKSEIKINVYICSNEDYEKQKAEDDSRIEPIVEFEITGKIKETVNSEAIH